MALLLSGALGLAAQRYAFQDGAREWERAHPPTDRIWRAALESRQLSEIQNPNSIQRVARTLPSMNDSAGAIWSSPDLEWIAITREVSSLTQGFPYLIFSTSGERRPPGQWQPSGNGWPGFESILARLDLRERKPQSAKTQSTPPKDPRDIRY